jgi:hypothetical protein
MCVTLYLIIQQHINVNADQLEDWFTSYIGMANVESVMDFMYQMLMIFLSLYFL